MARYGMGTLIITGILCIGFIITSIIYLIININNKWSNTKEILLYVGISTFTIIITFIYLKYYEFWPFKSSPNYIYISNGTAIKQFDN
jgi:membrane protein YdbS with pleckstrin-like domain